MTYVRRSASVAARMLGGEMMIMSGRDSTLYSLNPTAAAIWNAADGVTPLERIVEEKICALYEAEPAEALRDALELVEGLAREGILLVSGSPLQEPAA
jgi:hypothetical protein